MYGYLLPLGIGFACNWASALTFQLCRRFGERPGRRLGFVLRNVLGIPVWVAGVLMAARQPAAPLFTPGPALTALSWLLLLAGTLPMLPALGLLKARAYRPTTGDTLVSGGIFRFVRHPIYSGLLVEFAALALKRPSRPVLLACALGFLYVQVQARLEEADLRRRVPGYGEYMKTVPRFIPRIKGIRPKA